MMQPTQNSFFIKETEYLASYHLLTNLIKKEVFGEPLTNPEKQEAVLTFLTGLASQEDILKYRKRLRVNPDSLDLYPHYYIPPYHENKKLRLAQGYLPKTHLLYANYYELEILRLLFLFNPENGDMQNMITHTLHRLKNTCFANSCSQGECTTTGISVLRFLAAVQPDNTKWIDALLNPLAAQFLSFGPGQAAVQNGIPLSYLLMALTDLNNEMTRYLISQKKEWLLDLLRRGWITGRLSNGKISEGDTYNLMGKYILRNALGTLPEYKDIQQHKIYICNADDRCYCDI